MKITLPVADFDRLAKRALQFAGRGRDISPDYQLLLIELTDSGRLRLSAHSAGAGAVVMTKIEGGEPGSVAIPAEQVDKIVGLLPKGIENKLVITAGRGPKARFKIGTLNMAVPTRPAEDFPPLPKPPSGDWFQVKDDALSDVIKRTLWAMCRDETRPTLAGVHLTSECSETTDGHMLARLVPGLMAKGQKVVVPGEAWNKLRAFVGDSQDMRMFIEDERRVWLRSKSWAVFTTLISGKFPDTSPMIFAVDDDGYHQSGEKKVRVHWVHVNRHETLAVVRRIVGASVSQEEKKIGASVSFEMKEGALHLVSHYPFEDLSNSIIVDDKVDWGEGSITADDMSGFEALKGIGLYSTYMKMALESLSSDVIRLLWSEAQGDYFMPVQFHDDKAGMKALVMPRRL